MFQLIGYTAATVCAGALALGTLSAVGAPEEIKLVGEIEFAEPTSARSGAEANEIRGWYQHAGSLVSFEAQGLSAGRRVDTDVVPEKVIVRLEVNDAVLDHQFDNADKVVTIDGHSVMLGSEHVKVLGAFYPVLEKALDDQGLMGMEPSIDVDGRPLWNAPDALNRVATMYSEAPAGVVIGRREVTVGQDAAEAPATSSGFTLGGEPIGENASGGKTMRCNQSGGDGIFRFDPSVCWRYDFHAWTHHDARNHCMVANWVQIGCKEATCVARCGAGCGRGGAGNYSKDCMDHDKCLAYHGGVAWNGTNPDCGDEFGDAVDDYLVAYTCGACR